MTQSIGKLIQDKDHAVILDSLLPGGLKWEQHVQRESKDCLRACPNFRDCDGYGPSGLCTSDWRDAEFSPRVIVTLLHVVNEFDYYNQGDLSELSGTSPQIAALQAEVKDRWDLELSKAGYPEGAEVTRLHSFRERSSRAASTKKQRVLAGNSYPCPCCRTDFLALLGPTGRSVYHCHHIVPLANDREERITRDVDLLVLCANCHNLVHSKEFNGNHKAVRAAWKSAA